MKKIIALLLVLVLAMAVFVGCDSEDDSGSKKSKSDKQSQEDDSGSSSSKKQGYKDILNLYVKTLVGADLTQSQMKSLQPESYFDYHIDQGEDIADYYESIENSLNTNSNCVISIFGDGIKIKYEVTSDEKLSDKEQTQATKHFNSEPWYDAGEMEEVRQLVLDLTIEGDKDEQSFEPAIKVMKYSGKWYILEVECPELEEIYQ